MLTIQSGLTRNIYSHPSFKSDEELDDKQLQEKYQQEHDKWVKDRNTFAEVINDTKNSIPKPVKTGAIVCASFATGGIAAAATGWSTHYAMTMFKRAFKSDSFKGLKNSIKNGFNYVSENVKNIKTSDSFKSIQTKISKWSEDYKKSSFNTKLQEKFHKFSENTIVKAIVSPFKKALEFIGDCTAAAYKKLSGMNKQNAIANTVGAAGGVSTGALTLIENTKPEPKKEETEGEDNENI